MPNKLSQIIRLAKNTGDRIIAFDNSAPDDSFVVMSLDQYEELQNIKGENNDLQKPNISPVENQSEDLNIKEETKEPELENLANIKENIEDIKILDQKPQEKANNLTEEKITDRINFSDQTWKEDKNFQGDNVFSSAQIIKNRFKNNNWQIPETIKQAAEEVEGE